MILDVENDRLTNQCLAKFASVITWAAQYELTDMDRMRVPHFAVFNEEIVNLHEDIKRFYSDFRKSVILSDTFLEDFLTKFSKSSNLNWNRDEAIIHLYTSFVLEYKHKVIHLFHILWKVTLKFHWINYALTFLFKILHFLHYSSGFFYYNGRILQSCIQLLPNDFGLKWPIF